MKKTLVNFFIWICYGCLLLSQPGQAIRIKRSDSLANATDNIINNNTESTLPVLAMALGTAAMSDRQQVKNASEAAVATLADIAAAAAATTTATISDKDKELEIPNDLSAHLHRNKRRMSGVEESLFSKALHHGRRHNPPAAGVAASAAAAVTAAVPAAAAAAAPAASTPAAAVAAAPYVYYNKMISPDGKQELKEFQLLSPNMVIESVQHDMNYGPTAGDLGGVLLLNTGNNLNGHLRALAAKPAVKHHHKHKSLAALPPFLFLLQQMLQPNMNIELEPTLPHPQSRNRLDTPLYQFLDSAVDNALRNNHEVYEHFINEHDRDYELSMKDKQKEKDKEKLMDAIDLLPMQRAAEKTKAIIESGTKHKEDELVVTCPIHHEHHTNINGDMVDDDVVLVNECHII